jgi:hypothetical protein
MSKYLLDKFLYTVDRDPDLVERYRDDPTGFVEWWEREMADTLLSCIGGEKSTWLSLTDDERRALREQDHVTLFEMGAHPFLTLTLFIAMFERDHGPLEYQKAYGRAMAHISLPYPDIAIAADDGHEELPAVSRLAGRSDTRRQPGQLSAVGDVQLAVYVR